MRTTTLLQVGLFAGALLLSGGTAMAAGTTTPTPPPPPAVIASNSHSLFVVRGQNISSYNPATLALIASKALPAPPSSGSGGSTTGGQTPPPPPPILAANDASVFVILGQTLYALNGTSLDVAAQKALPAPPKASATTGGTQAPPPPPPALSADATHVYVVLGKTLYTFDAGTLNPLSSKDLPAPTK